MLLGRPIFCPVETQFPSSYYSAKQGVILLEVRSNGRLPHLYSGLQKEVEEHMPDILRPRTENGHIGFCSLSTGLTQ